MEPLSGVASVIAVLQLTEDVIRYVRSSKDGI